MNNKKYYTHEFEYGDKRYRYKIKEDVVGKSVVITKQVWRQDWNDWNDIIGQHVFFMEDFEALGNTLLEFSKKIKRVNSFR